MSLLRVSKRQRRTGSVRWTAAAMGAVLCSTALSFADPQDAFDSITQQQAKTPDSLALSDAEPGVSEQQGTATYRFDVTLPPGRNGMKPSLALEYSSGGELRGGLGVGWNFSLPNIER